MKHTQEAEVSVVRHHSLVLAGLGRVGCITYPVAPPLNLRERGI